MDFYQEIISKLKKEYEQDDNILAMFITGSVARGEAHEGNDLDILLVAKKRVPFKEYRVGESLVEIGGGLIETSLKGIEENPMKVYLYLDAKAVFDKGNYLQQLQKKAQQVLDSYKPSEEEKNALRKWLVSVVDKVTVAKKNSDIEKVGFHVSNVLWKTVEGLYLINSGPTPASTSALKRIHALKTLPNDFNEIWKKTLLGNLDERTNNTLALIQFILSNIK